MITVEFQDRNFRVGLCHGHLNLPFSVGNLMSNLLPQVKRFATSKIPKADWPKPTSRHKDRGVIS